MEPCRNVKCAGKRCVSERILFEEKRERKEEMRGSSNTSLADSAVDGKFLQNCLAYRIVQHLILAVRTRVRLRGFMKGASKEEQNVTTVYGNMRMPCGTGLTPDSHGANVTQCTA